MDAATPTDKKPSPSVPAPREDGLAAKVRFYGRKAVGFILMALLLGILADFAATRNNEEHPAGLAWGMAHGALMPTTLPALIMGKDVTIYAPHNRGRVYKIGYALGVNVCGLMFFGALFWNPKEKGKTAQSTPEEGPPM